jgi:hypothetical protein
MPLFQSGIFFEPRSVKKANSYQYQFNAGQTNASWSFTQALNGEVNFKENPASGTPGGSTLLTPTIYDLPSIWHYTILFENNNIYVSAKADFIDGIGNPSHALDWDYIGLNVIKGSVNSNVPFTFFA